MTRLRIVSLSAGSTESQEQTAASPASPQAAALREPAPKWSWRKALVLLGLFCLGAWLAVGMIVAMVF